MKVVWAETIPEDKKPWYSKVKNTGQVLNYHRGEQRTVFKFAFLNNSWFTRLTYMANGDVNNLIISIPTIYYQAIKCISPAYG